MKTLPECSSSLVLILTWEKLMAVSAAVASVSTDNECCCQVSSTHCNVCLSSDCLKTARVVLPELMSHTRSQTLLWPKPERNRMRSELAWFVTTSGERWCCLVVRMNGFPWQNTCNAVEQKHPDCQAAPRISRNWIPINRRFCQENSHFLEPIGTWRMSCSAPAGSVSVQLNKQIAFEFLSWEICSLKSSNLTWQLRVESTEHLAEKEEQNYWTRIDCGWCNLSKNFVFVDFSCPSSCLPACLSWVASALSFSQKVTTQ